MTGGFEHGKTYTVISYFYPDTRPTAAAFASSETFTFESGQGEMRPGLGGHADQILVGLTMITVPPGWLWREVMEGRYDTSGVKPTWRAPNVVPFTGAGQPASPAPGSTPTP
jgi:hypothetical protein